jgi:hypothetical protein
MCERVKVIVIGEMEEEGRGENPCWEWAVLYFCIIGLSDWQ